MGDPSPAASFLASPMSPRTPARIKASRALILVREVGIRLLIFITASRAASLIADFMRPLSAIGVKPICTASLAMHPNFVVTSLIKASFL